MTRKTREGYDIQVIQLREEGQYKCYRIEVYSDHWSEYEMVNTKEMLMKTLNNLEKYGVSGIEIDV